MDDDLADEEVNAVLVLVSGLVVIVAPRLVLPEGMSGPFMQYASPTTRSKQSSSMDGFQVLICSNVMP